jgi:hypothetical protein
MQIGILIELAAWPAPHVRVTMARRSAACPPNGGLRTSRRRQQAFSPDRGTSVRITRVLDRRLVPAGAALVAIVPVDHGFAASIEFADEDPYLDQPYPCARSAEDAAIELAAELRPAELYVVAHDV